MPSIIMPHRTAYRPEIRIWARRHIGLSECYIKMSAHREGASLSSGDGL